MTGPLSTIGHKGHVFDELVDITEWSKLWTCCRDDARQQIIEAVCSIMSAYYGNLLPANLASAGAQDSFLGQEAKFDANFYSSVGIGSGGQGLGYDSGGGGDPQNPGYPRFPPYDRLDIGLRPINSKPGFTTPQSVAPTYQQSAPGVPSYGLASSGLPQAGQYTMDDLNNSKYPDSGQSASVQVSSAQANLLSPFNAGGLGGMLNGMHHQQTQNLPIYPWMRPMNGGKLSIYAMFTPVQNQRPIIPC